MTGEEFLALGDDAFCDAWFNLPDEGRQEFSEAERRRCYERYSRLHSYVMQSASKKANGGTQWHDPEKPKPALTEFVDGAHFISNIMPPQWLIDGVIQRSYLYGLTAPTNHGKTALAALMAVSVALGINFASHACEPGHVLYLAGENPEDFKLRLRGACQANNAEAADIEGRITVMPVVGSLTAFIAPIKQLADSKPIALILIDTSMAYFGYPDENANVDIRMHAQDMRMLIQCAGSPAIIALCHPTKNATQESLTPRGGSAFMNELDCNLTLWKEGEVCEIGHNKLRGPPFIPVQFKLIQCVINGVLDTKGREVNTVVMRHLSDSAAVIEQDKEHDAAEDCLRAIGHIIKPTMGAIAERCGWKYADGRPDRSKAQRIVKTLIEAKFVRKELGKISLTQKGKDKVKYDN